MLNTKYGLETIGVSEIEQNEHKYEWYILKNIIKFA